MSELYQRTQDDVLTELESSASGLSEEQAEERLERYGENKLAEAKKTTVLQRFFQQLKDPMLLILLAAAAVSAVTNALSGESFTEVFIILVVVLLNAVLGVIQESKAEAAIEALQSMTAAKCKVLRGGELKVIESSRLVPGDVVVLEAGDAVPADGRLLESASLKIEEAALTGESVPVIGQSALRALLPECEEGYITLSCTTAGGSGTLRAFYCDSVCVNGRDLGRRLVTVSPDIYGDSGFQGVWRMEEQEGAHELVQAALE